MSPAECKCLRESMGLTTKWLAGRWGVAEYSVKRWERDRRVPDDLAADLTGLRNLFDRLVGEGVDERADAIPVPRVDAESPDDKPAAWHRIIAQRISEQTDGRILYYADADQ
ncbi:hypothetical protein JS533_001775 [Bifidobacterium amazonense]|uniref:XRE family transcriptional regulator n=1 Tax=Bifidobacterium amazonense TaxID=2809027 RepID=A0ABS9VSF1_9BIFI|nr:hypothetical protein [Bifidobacterium amazonense]MCH9275018.1 hypothetical protein [Bifidobacterium amazonense]